MDEIYLLGSHIKACILIFNFLSSILAFWTIMLQKKLCLNAILKCFIFVHKLNIQNHSFFTQTHLKVIQLQKNVNTFFPHLSKKIIIFLATDITMATFLGLFLLFPKIKKKNYHLSFKYEKYEQIPTIFTCFYLAYCI